MSFFHYFVFVFYVVACNSSEGKPGMSESIKESKKREVYICEYEPVNRFIIISDTIKVTVDVVWVERKWVYSSNENNTIILKGYQLIIHTIDKLDENYSFSWTIGTDFKRNFRVCGYSCIMTDFDSLPKNMEKWKIQRGRSLYDGAAHKIVGELILKRKQ